MAAQLELSQRPFIELQIEALLNENRLKPKRVSKFIDQLETRLTAVKDSVCEKLSKRTYKLPIIGRPNSANADYPKCFKFKPPEQIDVVGGFRTSTTIKRRNYVDLAICMPTQCFEKKDIKNQRYHHKRALYLAQIALLLSSNTGKGLVHSLKFKYYQGDLLKPVLIIEPHDEKLRRNTSFQLFCYLTPESAIKSSLLNPKHGNVSPRWFFKDYPILTPDDDEELKSFLEGDSDVMLSPFYNSGILFDLEMMSNSDVLAHNIGPYTSVIDALMLVKIWLYQRNLHHSFSFILSMYIACLQTQRLIHHNMSSYQIFKQVIKSLVQSDWISDGLSYYEDSRAKISAFKAHFPLVFLSPSGHHNLCYNISKDLYLRLKHEAQLSHRLLEANSTEAFDLLFLEKIEFISKFDALVHLPKSVKKIPLKQSFLSRLADYGALTHRIYSVSLLDLIERSLTDRVVLIQQDIESSLSTRQWEFNRKPYDPTDEEVAITYGLLLDVEKSLRTIDVGPPAETPEAEAFRQFWEPKCQLRLQNGVISETVVWPVQSFSQRRDIIRQILSHILSRAHFNEVSVHYTFLERFISLDNVFFQWRDGGLEQEANSSKRRREELTPIGVGEEIFQKVAHSYNELNKILRNIDDMQHSITAIQPMSAHLRGSAVFPALPASLQSRNDSLKRQKGAALFPAQFSQTSRILHLEPVEILLSLESTGKWPNELEAFEAAKLEYLVELGEELREREYSVKFAQDYLDVMHGQFVFRLRVKCAKELHLVAGARGKQEYQLRRLQLEIRPRLEAALDQLYRERPAFGLTCRLVKRWIYCQLMTDHMPELVLDLLVARVFLQPEPYTEPASSASGFRRTLMLIAHFDWRTNPLVVNFDQQLKQDEINQLRDQMAEDRSKFPPIVIRTPFDKDTSPWTRREPTLVKLDLTQRMCAKALELLDKCPHIDCEPLFRPNLHLFHLLIKLHSGVVQNFFMNLDPPQSFRLRGQEPQSKQPSAFKVMPVVGLNLVEQFVVLLREKFDQLALFFYDKYGQRTIGVVLRPNASESLGGDLEAFANEIRQLGAKMVDSVQVNNKTI